MPVSKSNTTLITKHMREQVPGHITNDIVYFSTPEQGLTAIGDLIWHAWALDMCLGLFYIHLSLSKKFLPNPYCTVGVTASTKKNMKNTKEEKMN